MKRMMTAMLALLTVAALSACSAQNAQEEAVPENAVQENVVQEEAAQEEAVQGETAQEEKSYVLEDIYQNILNAQSADSDGLVHFPEANPDAVESIYPGLSDIELNQLAIYLPPVFGFANEIMLAEVAREEDVEQVEKILQDRIDRGASDTDYPDNAKPWAERAEVQTEGRYVCMIVLPEGYVIPEDVFAGA